VTDFLQLLVFFFAAVNPPAAAAAPEPGGAALPARTLTIGAAIALALVLGAALLAEPILDGLGVEPETFRVGAGVIFLAQGALVVWLGRAPHAGAWDDRLAGVSPLGLPVLATAPAIAAAVSYGADRGEAETAIAAAIIIASAVALLWGRAGRYNAAVDALARLTGALLVIVAAGLVVSGVRAI
jgi:small neutral amino acid transporter SnatA (MarC family)